MKFNFAKMTAATAAWVISQVQAFFVRKIKSEKVKAVIDPAISALIDCFKALADANPNNEEQLLLIANSYLKSKPVTLAIHQEFSDLVSKLKDENVEAGVYSLLEPVIEILQSLGDGKSDKEQIEAIYKNWLNSGKLDPVLLPMVANLLERKHLPTRQKNLVLALVERLIEELHDQK